MKSDKEITKRRLKKHFLFNIGDKESSDALNLFGMYIVPGYLLRGSFEKLS